MVIGSCDVLDALTAVVVAGGNTDWALATMGRLPAHMVRERLMGTPLMGRVEPMLLMASNTNWLTQEATMTRMAFLRGQVL